VDARRNSAGKEFHAVGPAAENDLSAKRLYVGDLRVYVPLDTKSGPD